MKKTLTGLSMALLVVTAFTVSPLSVIARNSNNTGPVDRTVIGYISDSMCGGKHMSGMGDDKNCTLMCVKNGKFVLADRDHKRVYQLDKAGQEKAREFAGQKVKVTGRISGKTIKVSAIEAAT